MSLKHLALTAVFAGAICGTCIALFYNREKPIPAYNALLVEGTNQKRVYDAFARGYIAQESQLPENLAACQGLSRATSIFCFEGYWYSKYLVQLRAHAKPVAAIPLDLVDYTWTEGAELARGTALTAFGMAIAEAGETPSSYNDAVSKPELMGHLFDGWIFMLARSIGLASAAERCQSLESGMRSACEFGVGRAAWFESSGDYWIKGQNAGVLAGFEFAKRFTSQNSAEELNSLNPQGFGEKVAIVDKLLWFGRPAKDAESAALYECQAQKHPANCRRN